MPFFNPENAIGEVNPLFTSLVTKFFTEYVEICAERAFAGGSKVMIASPSEIKAVAFRTACGIPTARPTGGFLRISSIIARRSGPGSLNISPASKFGVMIRLLVKE